MFMCDTIAFNNNVISTPDKSDSLHEAVLMKKAQVSLEYLILTAFILVIVIIIFAFALFNYESNIKMAKVGNNLDSLVKTADLVYARGYGTALYATVSWPNGVSSIEIVNKCKEPEELYGCPGGQRAQECYCDTELEEKCINNYDCIKYSAVHVVMDDGTDFLYGSKAKLLIRYKDGLDNWQNDLIPPEGAFPLSAIEMKVKVLWVGTKDYIALQGIPD